MSKDYHFGFVVRDPEDDMFYHMGIGWTNKPLLATIYATEEAAASVAKQFGERFVIDMVVATLIVRPPKEEIQ